MPEPDVASGEIKIRVRACSMCGTDVKISRAGHPNMTPPQVMGHEIARVQVIAAMPDGTCEDCVDANLVHYRELTIVGVNGSTPAHNEQALELIASGAVPVADLITHRLPLDEMLDAIEIVARGDAIKVTIEP